MGTVVIDRFDGSGPQEVDIRDVPEEQLKKLAVRGSVEAAHELVRRIKERGGG